MNLYFEDWSEFIPLLDQKELRHGGRIIKVFATEKDVRLEASRNVLVVNSDGSPFGEDEIFDYGERGSYSGTTLETDLANLGLNELGRRIFRSLFRFSYAAGFNQSAMAEHKEDGWLISHPFEDIDEVKQAALNPEKKTNDIHLDVFFPESLATLDAFLGIQREGALVDKMKEGMRMREKPTPKHIERG